MSITFSLLCVSIIMIILIFLNIIDVLPDCDDSDSSQTDLDNESGWKWAPLFGDSKIAEAIKNGLGIDLNPPFWFDKLNPRKGISCWPSKQAPMFLNIQFLAFLQFILWIVFGDFLPGSFNGFPILASLVSPVIFFKWLYFTLPGSTSGGFGTTLSYLTQLFIVFVPFIPVIKRWWDTSNAIVHNCGEILRMGKKLNMSPIQVAKVFGYNTDEKFKESPFYNCEATQSTPENVLLSQEQMDSLTNMVENGNPRLQSGGSDEKGNQRIGWKNHIAKTVLNKAIGYKVGMTDFFVRLVSAERWNFIKSEWFEFYIDIPNPIEEWEPSGIRFGVSDIIFTVSYISIFIAELMHDIISWIKGLPTHIDQGIYVPNVPRTLSMFWHPIPTYYAIGGSNESCSNIFYMIYLFRVQILLIALIGLVIFLIFDVISFIRKNIRLVLTVIAGIILFSIMVGLMFDGILWLWNNALIYIFYKWPKALIEILINGFFWVFEGMLSETIEILKLYSNTLF